VLKVFYRNQPQIGTAWHGRHIILVRCNPYTNQFIYLDKSLHAPIEPPHETCAETVAQLISIGYTIQTVVPISHTEVQYVLVK